MILLSHSCQQMGKNWPTHESRYRASAKISFIIAIQPFCGCQRSARKNITVTVSVRVIVTVRVSLVWFVSSNSFGGVKCRHLPVMVVSPVLDAIDTTVVSIVHLWMIHDSCVRRVKYKGHDTTQKINKYKRATYLCYEQHSAGGSGRN